MVINPGLDASGNGNNWTPINIEWAVEGTSYDIMVDSPTNYGTDTGVGGEVRGNYATLNPLNIPKGGSISNGNLNYTAPSAEGQAVGTMYASSGKWYWELVQSSGSGGCGFGIAKDTTNINSANLESGAYVYYSNGNKYNASTASSFGSSFTTGDVIGVALDLDSGKVWFAKNGTWQASGNPSGGTNEAFSGLSGNFTALIYDGTGAATPTYTANFGQRPFAYTAPSGFKALCTTNLPEPTVAEGKDYFNAVLYTGTGSSQSITGLDFQPDLVWIKSRSNAVEGALFDVVRGTTKGLFSSLTNAEFTDNTTLTAFNSNGFTVGGNTHTNLNNYTYVGWNWKANGAGVSNPTGTITSTISASSASGFSIITYTGTGSSGTLGHGLGQTPAMIITKRRDSSDQGEWQVSHQSLTGGITGNGLFLNTTAAQFSTGGWISSVSSTTIGLSSATSNNGSGRTFVMYAFAPIAGYSAFGSYTGNGSSDGTFVYTGFRPRYLLIKVTNLAGYYWNVHDTARNPYNSANLALYPNTSNADDAYAAGSGLDILSNGFKIRDAGGGLNANGSTYIYAAFAENPFKLSRAR